MWRWSCFNFMSISTSSELLIWDQDACQLSAEQLFLLLIYLRICSFSLHCFLS